MAELEEKETQPINEVDNIEEKINEEITEVEENEETTNDKFKGFDDENFKQMSPTRLVMRRFFRSKLSIVGIVMIALLFLFSFLGPVIYRPFVVDKWAREDGNIEEAVDRTPVTIVNESTIDVKDADGNIVATIIEVTTFEDVTNRYASPSKDHLLGTDDKGMDVFTRLMYGGRISLTIGFIVVILETIIGVILGGLAGYFGKWVDQLIMRIVDIFNCIPTLPILLISSFVIDSWNPEPDQKIYILMIIITIFSWSGVARLVRGQILSLREQEYITATEVMGLPTWRKIFKHLIPNVMPQLIVSMTLGLGSVILYESTLSYLGLGVQLPKAAWGSMISLANDPVVLNYHVNMWLPAGFMIVIAVLGFNFVGDGLRDAMDPKAKK